MLLAWPWATVFRGRYRFRRAQTSANAFAKLVSTRFCEQAEVDRTRRPVIPLGPPVRTTSSGVFSSARRVSTPPQ